MHLIKVTLWLSLLALCHKSQVQAFSKDFDKYLQCIEVINDGVSLLIENTIPAIKILVLCLDYQPQLEKGNSFLKYIRIVHQFAKKAIYHKPDCLNQMFSAAVTLLKPQERKLDSLNCFED
ncbi:accessory gland protein Acp53Ea-like [Drosophila miranda]|uniref:accessory gland protein Acp53Ea-like n=1 Tax=Drosophila miranda TaxID=7229 RepID=UPI00143FA9B7|nr:accessory gland protein Acp53Ea-like [Drosophila miranda]